MSGWLVFLASVLALAGIYAVLATILNLEVGWAGLWDLGTAGLLAVGAYAYVILTVHDVGLAFNPGWPMWAGVIGASLFTGLVALLIGLPALRMRGEYFLITTFAFSIVVLELVKTETAITQGAAGFQQIARPFGTLIGTRAYNFALLAMVLCAVALVYFLMQRLGHSPFGRLLRAQRDNEAVALALGKNVTTARLKAFVLAGLLIGATAPLYVWYIRALFPHLFHPALTFTVWTALVIGGVGGLGGPILGALLLIGLIEATQFLNVSPEHAKVLSSLRPIIVGLALILVMRYRPQGLLPESRSFATSRGSLARTPDSLTPSRRELSGVEH